MKAIRWWIAAPSAVLVVAATALLQTASAEDVIYKAWDGALLTAPQASTRLTGAVSGVWIGGLTTLKKIACAKQDTTPATFFCEHKGTGEAEFSAYRTARAAAASNPLRDVRMTGRVPGTTRVEYYQAIRISYTVEQFETRYTTAASGIWRGIMSELTGVTMAKSDDIPPYKLVFYGVVAAPEGDYLDAFEAAESDELQYCQDVADVVED